MSKETRLRTDVNEYYAEDLEGGPLFIQTPRLSSLCSRPYEF